MRVLDKIHGRCLATPILPKQRPHIWAFRGHVQAVLLTSSFTPFLFAYDSYPISIPSFRRRLADTARHLTRPSPLDQLLVQRGVEAAERARVDGTRLCKLAAALVPLCVAAPQAARLMPVLTERCFEE